MQPKAPDYSESPTGPGRKSIFNVVVLEHPLTTELSLHYSNVLQLVPKQRDSAERALDQPSRVE